VVEIDAPFGRAPRAGWRALKADAADIIRFLAA
jgi:hypothetical protein